MAKLMTLGDAALGSSSSEKKCKCVYNPRTRRSMKLCFVGKSKKHRSGWKFVKGGC